MFPTQTIWHDAGYEDGLAGKLPIGDATSYLAGHAKGIEEFIKQHAEVRANLQTEGTPREADFASAEREVRRMVREGWEYDEQEGWKKPGKRMCPGKDYARRRDERSTLYRCTTCGRVNRTERDHQKPGRTTASHDNTMAILWDRAGHFLWDDLP